MIDPNLTRRAARVVLLTPEREVLLMHIAFPFRAAPIWVAPGGGLERDETWEEAAARELHEETGQRRTIGRLVFEQRFALPGGAQPRTQHERFFLVETARFEPVARTLEGNERAWFRGFGWWPLARLSSAPDVFSGAALAAAIERALV